MAKTYDFDDFCQITEMLRKKEGGCPWDLSQTHQSLQPYMLSETAEAVAAIDLYAVSYTHLLDNKILLWTFELNKSTSYYRFYRGEYNL